MMEQLDRTSHLTTKERALWLGIRQGLLLALRAIEVYLDLEPSRLTKRERGECDKS